MNTALDAPLTNFLMPLHTESLFKELQENALLFKSLVKN